MKHLKPKQHYIDRYDKATVERCRWYENSITPEEVQEHHKEKNLDKKELARLGNAMTELSLYFVKGEMYKNKEKTIKKWIKDDEDLDTFVDTVTAPRNIICLTCSREMFVSYSDLETNLDKAPKMLCMFDCTLGHLPKRAFYNDGTEWKREKPKCPKCSSEVTEKNEDTNKLFKTTEICISC